MTRPIAFIVPGPIDTRTGGSIYDRRIIEGLRALGEAVELHEIDASFPRPTTAALRDAASTLAGIPDRGVAVIDGLAFSAMPELLERESSRLRLVALVHLPLAADITLDADEARRLRALEGRALTQAALVVVTSRATLPMLEGYHLPPDRVAVVEPGTDRKPTAAGSRHGSVHALCVATVSRGKGHEILLHAFSRLSQPWRLTCAGSLTRDSSTADRVRRVAREAGVDDRVMFAGDLDSAALDAQYHGADLFVLATLQETYGMAVAEALAHGLPVVSTATGAIPDLVGDSAGVIVPPGSIDALAAALARVLADDGWRTRLAEGARSAAKRLPTWEAAAGRMRAALTRLDHDR